MRDFEAELRQALARTDPPPGFADRVLARTSNAGFDPRRIWRQAAAAAIAACLLVGTAGVQYEQQRRERAQGEAAKRQLLQALHITAYQLVSVERKVKGIGQ